MKSIHNGHSSPVPAYLDYDLISLSNTLAHSFEEGLRLATYMLGAPFFITNLYDYVIICSEPSEIDDPAWNRIGETRFCDPAAVATNPNMYSAMIPCVGKMVYYSAETLPIRQRQLVPYIAWIISQFGEERFGISDANSTSKSMLLLYLINEQFDDDDSSKDLLISKLPAKMQILAFFSNALTDALTPELARLCGNTEYIALYKQRYRILLFSHLTAEQIDALSDLLSRRAVYAGLSYPFSSHKKCHDHVHQAIVALNEAVRRERKEHLAQYEDLFALDVLYNYSSEEPLSHFRHPLFEALEAHDIQSGTELYKTLLAYIENSGNTQETAQQLSAHRNTVLYRMKQIAELTGYDVQAPACRASLLYAVAVEYSLKKQ